MQCSSANDYGDGNERRKSPQNERNVQKKNDKEIPCTLNSKCSVDWVVKNSIEFAHAILPSVCFIVVQLITLCVVYYEIWSMLQHLCAESSDVNKMIASMWFLHFSSFLFPFIQPFIHSFFFSLFTSYRCSIYTYYAVWTARCSKPFLTICIFYARLQWSEVDDVKQWMIERASKRWAFFKEFNAFWAERRGTYSPSNNKVRIRNNTKSSSTLHWTKYQVLFAFHIWTDFHKFVKNYYIYNYFSYLSSSYSSSVLSLSLLFTVHSSHIICLKIWRCRQVYKALKIQIKHSNQKSESFLK